MHVHMTVGSGQDGVRVGPHVDGDLFIQRDGYLHHEEQ